MSYCRFSSDAFGSDVYVYYHVHGYYAIHVAANRHDVDRSGLPPEPDPDDPDFGEKHIERHNAVMDLVEDAPLEPIGGPYDGDHFAEDTAEGAADRLEEVEAAGYNVPDGVIDALRNGESR